MNYLEVIAAAIADQCGSTYSRAEQECELWLAYALLAVTKGDATTSEDVHNAWALWATIGQPSHWSIIPFARLTPNVQAYDDEYRDAIRFIAQGMAALA